MSKSMYILRIDYESGQFSKLQYDGSNMADQNFKKYFICLENWYTGVLESMITILKWKLDL